MASAASGARSWPKWSSEILLTRTWFVPIRSILIPVTTERNVLRFSRDGMCRRIWTERQESNWVAHWRDVLTAEPGEALLLLPCIWIVGSFEPSIPFVGTYLHPVALCPLPTRFLNKNPVHGSSLVFLLFWQLIYRDRVISSLHLVGQLWLITM